MRKIVILDCGHSAVTPGKHSPDKSFYEWEFNRVLGRMIEAALVERGVEVFETVSPAEAKVDISLTERARRANEHGGDLFVSIHANAGGDGRSWGTPRGWSIYISEKASRLSEQAATAIAESHKKKGFKIRQERPQCLYWRKNFTVLTKTAMPAVLIENLFYDNPLDLAILKSEQGKRALTAACVEGICNFLER